MLGVGLSLPQVIVRGVPAAASGLLANKFVLGIGDSTMAGVGASPPPQTAGVKPEITNARPNCFLVKARDRLNSLGIASLAESVASEQNNTPAAWNEYRPEITVTGTLSTGNSRAPTAGGALLSSSSSSNYYSVTFEGIDTVVLWWEVYTGLGVMGISINGGAVTNYTQGVATEAFQKTTLTGLTLGTNTLTFTRVSGNAIFPMHIIAYNSAVPSVNIMNAGARNWTSTNWMLNTYPCSPLNAIGGMAPDVAVIALGINDYRQAGTSISTFNSNMSAIIAATGAPVTILVVPNPIQTYNTTTDSWSQAAVLSAYQTLQASTPNSILIDTPAVLFAAGLSGATSPATWSAINTAGYTYDSLHMKADVYAAMGAAIGDAIKTALGL